MQAASQVLEGILDNFRFEMETPAWRGPVQPVGSIIWIEGGQTFDPFDVASLAKRKGMDLRRVMRAIQVRRPFTASDLLGMVESIPQTFPHKPLVVIGDPTALFYDVRIPEHEAQRLFNRLVSRVLELRERASVVLLTDVNHVAKSRRDFAQRLAHLGSLVAPTFAVAHSVEKLLVA